MRHQTALLLVAALAACAPDGSEPTTVVHDSIDGIPRVRNLAGMAGFETTLGDPAVRIGQADGPEFETFGSIPAASFGNDGRIFVADGQAGEVRVFAPDGAHLRTFGRFGEGPGEFRAVDGLAQTPAGDVLVRDPALGRISRFTREGRFVSSWRLTRLYPQFANRRSLWIDGDGNLFDHFTLSSTGVADTIALARFSPDGGHVDTVVVDARVPARVMITRDGMPFMSVPLPYAPAPVLAVDARGRIISGDGAAYRLAVRGRDGATELWVEREAPALPVPAETADAFAVRLQRAQRAVQDGEVGAYRIPERQPYFTEVLIDAYDNIWVAREGDTGVSPTRYDVFSHDGRFRGIVHTPPMRILDFAGDRVLGRQTDESGVESVVVIALTPPLTP